VISGRVLIKMIDCLFIGQKKEALDFLFESCIGLIGKSDFRGYNLLSHLCQFTNCYVLFEDILNDRKSNPPNEGGKVQSVEIYHPLRIFKQCALRFLQITRTSVSEFALRKLIKWSKCSLETTHLYNLRKKFDLWFAIQIFSPYVNEMLKTRFNKISINKVNDDDTRMHTFIQ
jgi:hypothetical protein